MGRHDKPHVNIHIRYDAYMLERLDKYVALLNEQRLPNDKKWTRTKVIENIVDDYVIEELKKYNKKEDC